MTSSEEYERGLAEGQVRARIDDHGRRLDVVNGSIAKTGEALAALTAAVAELTRVANASEQRAAKYVPILETLEQRRTLGLKRWQVLTAVAALITPQLFNLISHLSGVG